MPTRRFDNLDPFKRTAILTAAAEEFGAHGFEAASMNRIIESAGTSKGSMYYYFEDKEDLYATVVRDTVQRFLAYCGIPKPVSDADGYWAEVERFTRKGMDYYAIDPNLAGVIRSLSHGGTSSGPLQEARTTLASWTDAFLTIGQSVGAVRDDMPKSLIIAVAVALSEGIDLWLAEHVEALGDDEREALIVRLIDMYRRIAAPLE